MNNPATRVPHSESRISRSSSSIISEPSTSSTICFARLRKVTRASTVSRVARAICSFRASSFGTGMRISASRFPRVSMMSCVNCFERICLFTIGVFMHANRSHGSITSGFLTRIFNMWLWKTIRVSLSVTIAAVPIRYVPSLTINMSPALTSSFFLRLLYKSMLTPCLKSAFQFPVGNIGSTNEWNWAGPVSHLTNFDPSCYSQYSSRQKISDFDKIVSMGKPLQVICDFWVVVFGHQDQITDVRCWEKKTEMILFDVLSMMDEHLIAFSNDRNVVKKRLRTINLFADCRVAAGVVAAPSCIGHKDTTCLIIW